MKPSVTIDKIIQVYALFARNINRKNSAVITKAEINQKYESCERQENSSYGRSKKEVDLIFNAINYMVKCGYISEIKKGVYKYFGNLISLRERIEYLQNRRNGINEAEEVLQKNVSIDELLKYKVVGTHDYTCEESYDDDDDDLFLDDDDDDDLKDLPGVFSWKREPTEDVSEESTDDNVTEESATEEKESYQTEMDKLLEELKQELEIADSNHEILETKTVDDAKIYVARLCKTRKEAKSKALEMQHKAQELDESSSSVIAFLGAYAEFDALSEKAYQKFRKENV